MRYTAVVVENELVKKQYTDGSIIIILLLLLNGGKDHEFFVLDVNPM